MRLSPGRSPDRSNADLSHPVVDFHHGLRSRVRRVRMAITPARRAILDVQITRRRAAHLDLWARPPGILRLPGSAGRSLAILSGVCGVWRKGRRFDRDCCSLIVRFPASDGLCSCIGTRYTCINRADRKCSSVSVANSGIARAIFFRGQNEFVFRKLNAPELSGKSANAIFCFR
jgi:hypothetical protein